MAHENNPDYMQLPLFRIVVDGMYYCGELVSNAYTFNDPFSSNSFHTAPGGKTTLEFSENHEKAKLIEGRNNLASHVKRVIEFVTCASDMPKEIKIERSPFPIPLTMNIDYFLDIESENTKLKAKIAELTNGKIDGLEIVMTKQMQKMIDKELKKRFEELKPELATRYEELLNMRNMEADQFNDGFNDARAGKIETDHPHYDLDTDNWRIGYAWGMFEPMKEKLARELIGMTPQPAFPAWIPVSERLPKESGWYRVGAINVFYEGYTDEVYFEANKTKSGWQSSVRDEIYCWLDGVPELPQPPEVQESEATSCEFCGSNKSDIRMNSIVCTGCGRKIGNIAPPEGA